MRRSLVVLAILAILLLSVLSEPAEASGSLLVTSPPSYLKVGDYVNYTMEQFSQANLANTSVTNFSNIRVVGINDAAHIIELHVIQNGSVFGARLNYYENTTFQNLSNSLPVLNTSSLSTANASDVKEWLGIVNSAAIEKNVSYSIGTHHYKTFELNGFFNYSSGSLNMTLFIDEKSGLLISENLTQYVNRGGLSQPGIQRSILYLSSTNIATSASNSWMRPLESISSNILSPVGGIFLGLFILSAGLMVYESRHK